MPRDSNGNYTLPAGNPVVAGEVISTGWANPTMSDLASEMSNSLDRQGRGGMLAPFKFLDGAVGAPGMTWTNEPTTGFYRAGASDMRATVAGVQRMRWVGTGVEVWDPAANGGLGAWFALVNGSGLNIPLLNAAQTFTAAITFAVAPTIAAAAPALYFSESDQAANEKLWRVRFEGKTFLLQAIDDALATTRDVLAATRGSGQAITTVVYGNATDNPTHTFHGAVSATSFAGAVAATTLSASGAVTGAGFTALFASPPAIGGTAAAAGAFTTLAASGTVSGAGITALFASPPAIGGTTPGAITGTTITATAFAGPHNGTVGASTPNTGAFTSLSASGVLSALSTLELGHASDTTLSRIAAGRVAVEGLELGYRGLPSASVTTGAFAAADAGKCVNATGGVTVPNNTMAAGDVVVIDNQSGGAITITATITTLYLAGTATTGNRTLAQNGVATIKFRSATVAVISGTGLT